MEWDAFDEEIRRELEDISLDGSETTSTTRSSSPSHQLPNLTEVTDVSALFHGYIDVTGGADGVDQVLNEVRDLLHTSPPTTPLHLTSLGGSSDQTTQPSEDPTPLTDSDNAGPTVLPPVDANGEMLPMWSDSVGGCELSRSNRSEIRDEQVRKAADTLEEERQLLEEQQRREFELNALIEESQRKLKEREQILHEREREKAAVKVQALARGYLSRQRYKKLLTLKTRMATVIQATWRGYQARERRKALMKAIFVLQRSLRRCRFKQRRLKAVLCVQKYWKAHQLARRERAGALLQRAWRRHRFLTQLRVNSSSLQTSDNIPDPLAMAQSDEGVPDQQSPDPLSTPQPGVTVPGRHSPDPLSTSHPDLTVPDKCSPDFFVPQPDEKVLDEQSLHPADTDPLNSSSQLEESVLSQGTGVGEAPNDSALAEKETLDKEPHVNTNQTVQQLYPDQPPSKEAALSHSPNKLTISRRIQSALRLVKQSNSAHQLEMSEGDSFRETRSCSLPNTTKKMLPGMKWSQLQVDTDMLATVLNGREKLVQEAKSSPSLKTANVEQHICEDGSSMITKVNADPVSRDQDSSSTSKVKSEQLHQVCLESHVMSEAPGSHITPEPHAPLESQAPPKSQTTPESHSTPESHTTPESQAAPESQAESVESESLALEQMRERRQKEVELAHQSRLRMSRLISEEEIQQVAKQKRAHDTYHNELDFAAQPLSPRAWCGLVSERLEQWKKHHHTWTMPTPHKRSSQQSHPHPSHTAAGTPLTNAQIIAASPKDTPLDQVAMVMMYRSRNPLDLRSLTKCPRLSSLSLAKCRLESLSKLEGCGQLQEVKVQSNNIEHLDLTGLRELSFADISDNRLASIHGLHSCSKLLTLDLSENRLARLAGLEGCHHLQRLMLDGNLIINSKGLSSVPLLQWLSCSENHLPGMEGLEKCSLLQHLNLAQNNLQQAPVLREHVLLRELRLEGNSLSEMGSLSQAWLPLLQTLSLANNCITELASLTCMVMLESLDVGNNSLYDLPVLLQCIRGCYQLRELVVSGNPVCEEPKLRYYLTKALPYLETLDERPLRSKAKIPQVVSSSSVYLLCKRQILEQDEARQSTTTELTEEGDGPPSPNSIIKALRDKVSSCQHYQSLLINHLHEHECLVMRDGPPPAPLPQNRLLQQTRAAVKIQATWRGFKGRKWAQHLRQTYNRAATVIQANYRGYFLRARLRTVLENARYMDDGCAPHGESGGGESESSVDFEEEIVVDYFDESALDSELTPLSPRDPLPRPQHTRETALPFQREPQIKPAAPEENPMVPLYSLPGCVETEVSFDEWRQLQKINRGKPHQEIVRESLGDPVFSEEGERAKGNPLAAWGSTTDMDEEVQTSDDKPDKVERITNEWGLQSSSTAELMMKRAQRQKKLHTKAIRRKKLEDPNVRLAAFRRKAPPTHILKAQQDLYRDQSPVAHSVNPHNQQGFVYQWVNNHSIMHERDYHHIQRGSSLLPPLEPRILAGQAPQLVTSKGQGQPGRPQHMNGSNSYPSMSKVHKYNETNSTSNVYK